ncbi:MAG: ABC transporter substrate-binding protein [Chloroflexi bacterium]|nr:ABC transporter substrate-binding protein [Chloroflexota bacterium]
MFARLGIRMLALASVLIVLACARAAPTATPTSAPAARPAATATTAPAVAPTSTPARVVAVASTPTPTRAPATPTPTARREPRGTLNVIDTLGNELWVMRAAVLEQPLWNMGDPLFWWDWNTDSPTTGAILESWDIKSLPDGSKDFIFKLRKGVKFHKGQGEVTAEDVKFSLTEFLKPGSLNPNTSTLVGFFGKDPNNIVVQDPYTLIIHSNFQIPLVEMLRLMSADSNNNFRPLPKKYMEQVGEDEFAKNPVYAGPYEFASQQRGFDLRLKAVPDHYRVTPGFAELRYLKVLEDATKLAMLRSNQVDIAKIAPRFAAELKATGLRVALAQNGIEAFIGFGGLFPGRPKYDPTVPWAGTDPMAETPTKVRKALNLVIDRQLVVDKLTFGFGQVNALSFAFHPNKPWSSPDWKPLPYDPKQAKQLLAEAGVPNCFEFKMWLIADQAIAPDIGEAAASAWETDLGCKIKRTLSEYRPVFRTMLIERNTSGWVYGYATNTFPSPYRYACLLGGPTYVTINHTEMPYFSELCPKADKTLDAAELYKVERQIGDLVYKTFPTVPLFMVPTTFGMGPKVKEWTPMPYRDGAGLLEYALPN